MAYDEGLAELMREDLGDEPGLSEKKMFGGLCFLHNGNMMCGVHAGGAMYRVGKAQENAAKALPGAGPLQFTGRPMGGMIDVSEDGLADDQNRAEWTRLAMGFVKTLPPK
jgi:TfoX/Sxy family transcriptional regulator of competence genes